MEKIMYENLRNVCRTCSENFDIKINQNSIILDIYYKLTEHHFEDNDELPKQICLKCYEEINRINTFALKCKETHSKLMDCIINYRNVRIKEEPEVIIEQVIIEEMEIPDEHQIDCVDVEDANNVLKSKVEEDVLKVTPVSLMTDEQLQNMLDQVEVVLAEDEEAPAPAPVAVYRQPQGKPLNREQKTMAYNVYMSHIIKGENKSKCVKATASETGVSDRSVWAIVRELETTGTLAPPQKKKSRRQAEQKLDEAQKNVLRQLVHSLESPTLTKLVEAVRQDATLPSMGRTTLWKILKKLGLDFNANK